MTEAIWAGIALLAMAGAGNAILWFEASETARWELRRKTFKEETGLDIGPRPHDENREIR